MSYENIEKMISINILAVFKSKSSDLKKYARYIKISANWFK